MGHRKKHAPKRGSLAYLPRGRAAHPNGRVRFWPEVTGSPVLLGFAGYKAGMTHVLAIEDRQGSPNFGKEIIYPVTIVDTPPMYICAVRAYTKDEDGLKTLTEAWASQLPKDFERITGAPKQPNPEENLKVIEETLDRIVEFRVSAVTQPRSTGVPKKKPDIMEIKVGGDSTKDQFEYIKGIMGKNVSAEDIFKGGQFIDIISVSKGKGVQGPVKRWGVRILQNKGRKTKRGIATLGAWGPGRILYTVPRMGQMGYHQRTEFNKRIMKIGNNGTDVTPKGGFLRYGLVRGSYVMVSGSIPGPAKRMIKMRYPARPPKKASDEPPQIISVSLESPQGV